MFKGKSMVAVVPARSGSKGIKDKNIKPLAGISLIGHAGRCLSKLDWLDAKVLSTDSQDYIEEGRKFGLEAPFLRPEALSSDTASAVDTLVHAVTESERVFGKRFDVVLIIEPTSPFRRSEDIAAAVELLVEEKADSVVTVCELDTKSHPAKVLKLTDSGKLDFYEKRGAKVVYRQSLPKLYWRNGVCYALTRECLIEKKTIFSDKSLPLVIEREIVNIDDALDFEWAEFLLKSGKASF